MCPCPPDSIVKAHATWYGAAHWDLATVGKYSRKRTERPLCVCVCACVYMCVYVCICVCVRAPYCSTGPWRQVRLGWEFLLLSLLLSDIMVTEFPLAKIVDITFIFCNGIRLCFLFVRLFLEDEKQSVWIINMYWYHMCLKIKSMMISYKYCF